MARKKKIIYPIHKMGKYCGYEKYEDGSIRIAQAHSQKIDDLLNRRNAVKTLLASVTKQCHDLLIPIEAGFVEFWKEIEDDYGFDGDTFQWTYSMRDKKISSILRKKETLKEEE